MILQPASLRGRRFLIQFYEVMREFGGEIPWLDGMNEMRFATNGAWFCEELQRRLGQREGTITPYQFVDEDDAGTFVGGILHFDHHPENLRDARNGEAVEHLMADGASYISCLQVRDPRRSAGVGTQMMQRAIDSILDRHGAVWGVVSDPQLIQWYRALGAELLSPLDNKDGFWIVNWNTPPKEVQ